MGPAENLTVSSWLENAAPKEKECWALVQRIAGSPHFAKAQQLHGILLYVCHRSLIDKCTAIGESEIGCSVLGRKPNFNTHEDNIVRVQVGHLRKRLASYFAAEGQSEPIILTIPKGSYIPVFEPRPAAVAIAAVEAPAPPVLQAAKRPHWPIALAALCLLSLGAYLWESRVWAASPRKDPLLWSRIFDGQPVSFVIADTCLVMMQDGLDVDIPLARYADGNYADFLLSKVADPGLKDALQLISSRQYSSLGDTNTTAKLLALSHQYGDNNARIRYARYLSVREFKNGNYVLIGSRRGIPWEQLFEPQLNFALEEDHATHQYLLRNKSPLRGEQQFYTQTKQGDKGLETYADIAFLPNLTGTGYVLILAGIGMEGSEAAGDLVASEQFPKMLSSYLHSKGSGSAPAYFEILLRTRAIAGATNSSEIVSFRNLTPRDPA